jgi:hypothetical protein
MKKLNKKTIKTNDKKLIYNKLLFFAMVLFVPLFNSAQTKIAKQKTDVMTWDIAGADFVKSPDYEVTLRKNGKVWKLFTLYSELKGVDKIIDHEQEGKFVKLSFGKVHSSDYETPESNMDTYAHSWAYFDFSNGPIEVEVKIIRPVYGITLPLQSCEVYPSSLGIECQVENNIIRFKMDKPAKIAVVPNSVLAIKKLEGMDIKRTLEGYQNPLFLFARNPEADIPSKDAEGTLVVKPGKIFSPAEFNKAKTIYFEPGVHDYSKYDPKDPNHYIKLLKGQTVYLPGGAFLYGIFNSDITSPLGDMPTVIGRGIISGDKQPWTGSSVFYNLIKNVRVIGVHIFEPHNHITHRLGYFKDVAVVGAWHGNTDGIGKNVTIDDPYTGWHADDCFCMAGDTNLALGGFGRVRNHTMWQLANAEPLWIQGATNAVADGINVLAYNKNVSKGEAINYALNDKSSFHNKIKVSNVLIDAPFINRIITVTSKSSTDTIVFEDVVFEGITVKTKFIKEKSVVGLISETGGNFGKVIFKNININGVKVTKENFGDYFVLLRGVTLGKEVIIE